MSEKIEWNIEECIQVIENLNTQGTLIKNAIAGIYNTFRYRISNEWSGHNYNIVVREVNSCAPEFREMTTFLGVTVPSVMQEIVNAQAENGQGYARTIALGSDNENPDIWEVPESPETADGSTRINIEALRPYITGAEYPSITAAIDLAKQYFLNYLGVFEQNLSTFQNNQSIMDAYGKVQDYKSQFESRTTELVEAIVMAADSGIEKIEEADITARKAAKDATGGDGNGNNGGSGPNSSGSSGQNSAGSSGGKQSGYVQGGSSSGSGQNSSGGSGQNSVGSSGGKQSGYVSGGSGSNSSGSSGSNSSEYIMGKNIPKGAYEINGRYYDKQGYALDKEDPTKRATLTDRHGDYQLRQDEEGGAYKEYNNGDVLYIDRRDDPYIVDEDGVKHPTSAADPWHEA